ncbi:MAG: hypothetical protein V1855_00100 [bacterium]
MKIEQLLMVLFGMGYVLGSGCVCASTNMVVPVVPESLTEYELAYCAQQAQKIIHELGQQGVSKKEIERVIMQECKDLVACGDARGLYDGDGRTFSQKAARVVLTGVGLVFFLIVAYFLWKKFLKNRVHVRIEGNASIPVGNTGVRLNLGFRDPR